MSALPFPSSTSRGAPVPKWPPASNITPHADGLAGWTYQQFVAALRLAKSKDGRALRAPMSLIAPYAKRMTDTELRAMWTYLQTVPKKPSKR